MACARACEGTTHVIWRRERRKGHWHALRALRARAARAREALAARGAGTCVARGSPACDAWRARGSQCARAMPRTCSHGGRYASGSPKAGGAPWLYAYGGIAASAPVPPASPPPGGSGTSPGGSGTSPSSPSVAGAVRVASSCACRARRGRGAHRQGAALARRLRERLMREPASLPPRRRARRPLASPAQPLRAHHASARRQQAAMHSCGELRNTFAPRRRGAPLRAAMRARTRGVLAGARHACCACRKRVRGAPGGQHSACSLGRRGALGGGGGARRAHARRAACGRVKAEDARRGCARRGCVQGRRRRCVGHCQGGSRTDLPADGDARAGPGHAAPACANAALP